MVLLRVYAKCIYGQEEMATQRIEAALALDSAAPTTEKIWTNADVEEEVAPTSTTTATPALQESPGRP